MEHKSNAAFILPAFPEHIRNGDNYYTYRQDSNLYYLTGFDEPDSFLVIITRPVNKTLLFVRPRDPTMEIWNGERYGVDGAKKVFGVDETFLTSEFETKLPEYLRNVETLYYRVGNYEALDRRVLAMMEKFRVSLGRTGRSLVTITDPQSVIGEMRLFKDAEEAALMRRSCAITAQAHKEVMATTKPGMLEYEVAANIESAFKRGGSRILAYDSIVGGGKNATCLHYHSNNCKLNDGDLVLIDAGGEYESYASDITRTFPVGRKFSPAQAKIYDLVLKVQKATVEQCRPGATFEFLHQFAAEALVEGLLTLGLLKGSVRALIDTKQHMRFYPHRTGHWLGLDVHDCGLYMTDGQSRVLEPGMVFTVEPGIYCQPGDMECPEEYRGIGVRIEDDIMITANGYENFTIDAPKEREAIEALRSS